MGDKRHPLERLSPTLLTHSDSLSMPDGTVPRKVSFVQAVLARAAELNKAEPVVAYYCRLHAAQQILESKLHLSDPEVGEFANALLSELESSEANASPEIKEILADKDAALAYVQNFALSIFDRGDRAIVEQRVSKTTASTLMAAAIFLDLERVWQPLSAETSEKIKYAKYQAARILKAIKAGQDPNELFKESSEPVDGELEQIVGSENNNEEDQAGEANADSNSPEPGVSLPDTPSLPPEGLPETPSMPPSGLPEAPEDSPGVPFNYPPPPKVPEAGDFNPAKSSERMQYSRAQHEVPSNKSHRYTSRAPEKENDFDTLLQRGKMQEAAQKHAKWAISALNYDDVVTAVNELKQALALSESLLQNN